MVNLRSAYVLPTAFLFLCRSTAIAETTYVTGTDANGISRVLADDRYPTLYSGNYGDCLAGGSLLNVTHFDTAYYADNMTVQFHLSASTNLRNQYVVLHISLDAYGENRFDTIVDPCTANISSLCPMNAATHISASAAIPVSSTDIAKIPSIAFTIPDVEASAFIRIYANTTQTQLACFQAVVHNGASFSQPAAISSVLGAFTILAILSSFAAAIYGANLPQIRTHFGHSLPVLIVFDVFQSIFFSGALDLAWPSVCVAWWSNFAWSAGVIQSSTVTSSVNRFVGISGNSSQAGAAGSVIINNNGGLQQQQQSFFIRSLNAFSDVLSRRDISGSNSVPSSTYGWFGSPVAPGLPTPGNWNGFAGTLQEIGVPLSSAFLIGLIWLLVTNCSIITCLVLFKLTLEASVRIKCIREDRLDGFRRRWMTYVGQITARSMFIALPMMMILTINQFTLAGTIGVIIVAAIFFVISLFGNVGVCVYACYSRLRLGRFESRPDRVYLQHRQILNAIPWFQVVRESSRTEVEKITLERRQISHIPFFRFQHIDNDEQRLSAHEDPKFLQRFGWLTAHYRRSRWWFFAVWAVYQFVRACFIGGAGAHPTVQVIGLFIVELVAMLTGFALRPFEGNRNLTIGVYMLGISKVVVTGLSIAFLPSYNTTRMSATIIGLVIIVIQALLTIAVLVLIILGVVSTYLSVMRDSANLRPRHWRKLRERYYQHLEESATDTKHLNVASSQPEESKESKETHFDVNAVQRVAKISDTEAFPDIPTPDASLSQNLADRRRARAAGVRGPAANNGLPPRSGRPHRASLTRKDFLANGMGNIDEDSEMSGDALSGLPKDPTRRASMKHMGNNVPRPVFLRPASSLGDIPKTPVSEDGENEKGLGSMTQS